MNRNIHILILEDRPDDAELVERELRKAKIAFVSKRVDTKEAFLDALTEFGPDIVLSDYSLPQFNGPEALQLLKQSETRPPFILVTGSLTEEVAVECMKEGAHDYILKTSLKRLPSSVLNALEKAKTEQEKARAEAALHRSEELYRLIAENTSDLICMLDATGNHVFVSPSYEEVLGYAPEHLMGQNCFSLIHPEDQEEAKLRCAQSLESKLPERFELRLKHISGDWRVFETLGNSICDAPGGPQRVVLVSRDLTERKQAEKALRDSEEQLRQSQKLEAIGQLAGGIAHDFNNLLTVITGYSDLLKKGISESDPNHSRAEEIRKAAERASSLTRQLLAFSRKQVLQPKVFDLNTLVFDMGKMLRRLIGEDIELITTLTEEMALINADPSQIEQVLMNLVVNARDAIPSGGQITIETSLVDIDLDYVALHVSVKPGQYVMLAVADNGCGMEEETRKHVFEPFFTTKENGKGTGLGLSTAYGIVKQSGGNVWVYSELGQGTTFKVYLPLAEQATQSTNTKSLSLEIAKGSETVLLVEDEPLVRNLAHEVLESNGYHVLLATNGEVACQICQEYSGPIQLMVTDVVMPQMSGRQLAERVAELRPDMAVLYMSGYTDDAVVRHGILDDEMPFLQKPFSPDALARKVRVVLEAKSSAAKV